MRIQSIPSRPFSVCLSLLAGIILLNEPALLGAERQFVGGHLPKAAATLQSTGNLPASKELKLAIALPLRNQESLSKLLVDLYDPASPRYRQYLTTEQFTDQFGPTSADYEALAAFAEANGLKITARHSNRTLLDVSGPVAAIEKTFHLTLQTYAHPTENRTFFAPDSEPTLDLKVPVLHISGLTDFEVPRPANLKAVPARPVGGGTPADGSGPSGSYRGNDFRRAYAPGVTLTGTGQMIGLLEFDTYFSGDIVNYRRLSGVAAVPLINVFIDGLADSGPGNNNIEVALDIEVANAMAPGVAAIIVYAGALGDDILNRMATDNLAKQLSASWTFSASAATDQIFQEFAAQGQAYFNASGDADSYVGAPSPVDHPFVIAVGGTTLTTGTSASYISETAWNWGLVNSQYVGTGGGTSTAFPIPSWQQGIPSMAVNGGSTTFRNVPDVSMIADNVWVAFNNGSSQGVGGTSISCPLWAAFTALINQQSVSFGQPVVGFLNPAVYAIGKGPGYSTNFHDITTGNNFNAVNPAQFSAVASYDLCTGWGTPMGSNTINSLAPRINARVLTSAGTSFALEGCSPANSVVDPNEVVTINFALRNIGAVAATNLVATLQTSGGVLAPSAPQNYGSLAAGVSATRTFSFTANATCGGTVVATLQLQDGTDNLGNLNFSFPVGKPVTTFSQNFDIGVTAPALPVGWTSTISGGASNWVTSTSVRDTALNSAFATESTSNGVSELTSVSIPITTSSAQLSFRQTYNFETDPALFTNAYDGGVLEIKIGAGAFTDILAAGGSFATNGYNRSISSTNTDNPLFGRQVWSAVSPGFITTIVNLPAAAAGQNIQLKWRFGTDNGNAFGGSGWYVDTVSIQDGFACCVPSANLAITQTPSTNAVLLGQDLSYTLSISNLGAQAVSSVSVTDTIPANVTFSSASPGCVFANGMVICNLGAMTAGSSNGVTVTVTPLAVGFVTNIVSVGSELLDPGLTNNFSTNITSVVTNVPPLFTLQPTNVIVGQGGSAGFLVSASGIPAPGYQWLFNGTNLLSATTSTLSLNNAQAADIGNYQAIATNTAGSATSSIAHLTVLIAPSIHLGGIGATGTNVTITVDSVAGLNYRLEYKNLLTDPAWTPVVPSAPGTGGSVILLDTNAPLTPTRFYRVSSF